jgi:hypothetical protein
MSNRTGFIRAISFLALGAFLAGCDSTSGPEVCLAIAEPALSVTVENAESGEPLDDALVIAREGSFADSARTRAGDHTIPATLAHERAGTYEVTAEKAGFSPWNRSGVVVPQGRCGPETVELTAQLAPSSE